MLIRLYFFAMTSLAPEVCRQKQEVGGGKNHSQTSVACVDTWRSSGEAADISRPTRDGTPDDDVSSSTTMSHSWEISIPGVPPSHR